MIALCGDHGWSVTYMGRCQWCAGVVHVPGNLADQLERRRRVDEAHDLALSMCRPQLYRPLWRRA